MNGGGERSLWRTIASSTGGRGVRAFLWLAALTPLLAHRLPLLVGAAPGSGSVVPSFPWLRSLGGVDFAWLLLAVLDGLVSPRKGLRVAGAALALLVLAAGAATLRPEAVRSGLPLRDDRAELRWVVRTPVGWGPDESDRLLRETPGVPLRIGPSLRHWLGTDVHGCDLLARLLHGARASLGVALCATALALGIGLAVGLASGLCGGWIDLLLMRGVEILLCFPHLFLVLVCFAYLPRERSTLVLLLGLVGWTTTARVARGEIVRLREEDFVAAAKALGASRFRIALVHLLPNALGPVLVAASFSAASALLAEFTLSFLGLGGDTLVPSLGQLLADGRAPLERGDLSIALVAGTLIAAIVASLNACGETLRTAIGRAP